MQIDVFQCVCVYIFFFSHSLSLSLLLLPTISVKLVDVCQLGWLPSSLLNTHFVQTKNTHKDRQTHKHTHVDLAQVIEQQTVKRSA